MSSVWPLHLRVGFFSFAPSIFDMSVGNMWWALLTGAAAVIPTNDQALPGQELIDLIAQHNVSHAKFTPSTLAALPADQLCRLTLITGGEVCTAELVDRYAAVATLVNEYGPTETTVDVTIGYPVAVVSGAALFVLDGWLRVVPAGVVGDDELGLDRLDRAVLSALTRSFGGGPVRVSTLAVAVGERPPLVEEVCEPFLVRAGMITRTPRGRVATTQTWTHLGMAQAGGGYRSGSARPVD